jgi:DNA segregation ATPase FtsK/SpoIIIE, S-DNA-T family
MTSAPADPPATGGTVVPLRTADAQPEVIPEGEIVDEPRPVSLRAVHAVRVIARHEHARTAGRNIAYVGIGAAVVVRRQWESRSTARYERHIRAAESA